MPLSVVVNPTGTVTMTIAQGESVGAAVTLSSGGTPINLTGYSIKMDINFGTPLLLTTANGGITITNAVGGICQINISDVVSDAFIPGTYLYEFWTISGAGQSQRLLMGQFIVLSSFTSIP